MGGFKKSAFNKAPDKNLFFHGFPSSSPNPFDSDDESDNKKTTQMSPQKTSSEHAVVTPELKTNLFDDDVGVKQASSSPLYSITSSSRNRYKNDFRESGGLEQQSVQELENYAVYKAEGTTKTVNNCVKIAENMRADATSTLEALHHQGEQITRTHMVASDIDQDLSRGEKLLGTLGGMFSRTWKPKKNRPIKGPVITRDNSFKRRGNSLERREKLGLSPAPKGRSNSQQLHPESATAFEKVEAEKAKQDDALSDLSNLLGELKVMAVDMGSEIERQSKALDHFDVDVEELNFRVKGANQRGRRLLGK